MISNPMHGWCNFKLQKFTGHPSYITDVPLDLLDAFINFYTKGYGAVVFDEEGSFFTFLITDYNYGIYIIEDKEKPVLHVFDEITVTDLADELIKDLENDITGWSYFMVACDEEEIKLHREIIQQKIKELKQLLLS